MQRFNMQTDLVCVLCDHAIENHSHIFGTCPYISNVLVSHGFSFTSNFESYSRGQFVLDRPTGIRRLMAYLFVAVAFYLVWHERNARVHDPSHRTPAFITRDLAKRMLRDRLYSSKNFQKAVSKDISLVMDLF